MPIRSIKWWWRTFYVLTVAATTGIGTLSWAAGPEMLATTDRGLWPHPVTTRTGFDAASRAEILSFVRSFTKLISSRHTDEWAPWLRVKSVHLPSLGRWRTRMQTVVLANFQSAAANCGPRSTLFCPDHSIKHWEDLARLADQASSIPDDLKAWAQQQDKFYETYLYEQARLAALFPAITSEILPLDDNEILGDDQDDLSFLLTFDDGPTAAGGSTDRLTHFLRQSRVNGLFFLLGENLEQRLRTGTRADLASLYQGMCLASHGARHVSHAKWSGWKESIDTTDAAVGSILPPGQAQIRYFRPPYGQRNETVANYINHRGLAAMFWNIDSQDWNMGISAEQVSDRVVSLMLLWRRGIVLFHDTHPKAETALPFIFRSTAGSGIRWVDCRQL